MRRGWSIAAVLVIALGACGTDDPGPPPAGEAGSARPGERPADVAPPSPADPAPPDAAGDTVARGRSDTVRHVPPAAGSDPGEWTAGIVRVRPPERRVVPILRSVRAAGHAGYDRVAWEFSGARPGVDVEYVDEPVRACGSGHPVDLPGDGWLEVRFEPAAAHVDGRSTLDENRFEPNLPVVLEVASTCNFEAVVTWVLAVGSPEPYRVTLLDDPPRVAVDVRRRDAEDER